MIIPLFLAFAIAQTPAIPSDCGIIRSIPFANRDEQTVMTGQIKNGICQPVMFKFPGGQIYLNSDNWNSCTTETNGETFNEKTWEECLQRANAREYTHPTNSQVIEIWGF